MSLAATLGLVVLIVYACIPLHSLVKNIFQARSSGFRFIVVPFSPLGISWVFAQACLTPILLCLPKRWTISWLPHLVFHWGWRYGYEPFQQLGVDTFLAVSPFSKVLYTCDPVVVDQCLRRSTFEKPARFLEMLNIYGPSMTGSTNRAARAYRRVTAPSFNKATYRQVWKESLQSTEALIDVLTFSQKVNQDGSFRSILARMTIHILSAVGFKRQSPCVEDLLLQDTIPPGNQMGLVESLQSMLDHYPTLYFTPSFLLRALWFKPFTSARKSFDELWKHLEGMRAEKESDEFHVDNGVNYSILDRIIQAASPSAHPAKPIMSPEAVLGNIFIFMFAGHEANANTITFICLLLACHPEAQKHLQKSIDTLLNGRLVSQMSFENDYNTLLEGFAGAVIYETLRLYTVLPYLPKETCEGSQSVVIGERTYIIPPKTLILLNTSATHRNPKYWPKTEPAGPAANMPYPVSSFDPFAWLEKDSEGAVKVKHPVPGSFIAFSDGGRGCLGRDFALTELCAVVARLFSSHSIELLVDGVNGDSTPVELRAGWERARNRAEHELSAGVRFDMSLRSAGTVPIRFVVRGREKFAALF